MVRKACLSDAKDIYNLIAVFAKKSRLLPRPLNYIYENIRDFWVFPLKGRIVACCALHIIGWQNLAEIKSLAVKKSCHRKGIGGKLVKKCLAEAKSLQIKQVLALTFVPGFFKSLGFCNIDKESLPHKIWSDCINCSFFPGCNEVALIKKL